MVVSVTGSPGRRSAEAYVVGRYGAGAEVPGRVAALLFDRTDLARLRVEMRGEDPEVDEVLAALTYVANVYRTRSASATSANSGSRLDAVAEVAPPLSSMSSGQAACALGITSRAIRLACEQGRLAGTRTNGRWRISRADLDTYRRPAA